MNFFIKISAQMINKISNFQQNNLKNIYAEIVKVLW
jgi:hypothetical protein